MTFEVDSVLQCFRQITMEEDLNHYSALLGTTTCVSGRNRNSHGVEHQAELHLDHRKDGGTLKTEINVPFGFLIVPPLKSPILGRKIGLFGPLFQRARLIWALEYSLRQGFLIIAVVWGSIYTHLEDRKFFDAAIWA